MRPRSIRGSAGSRIKVILGETGSDYLVLLDEDDGNREWQHRTWSMEAGGLPNGLSSQLNNLGRKGRYAKQVAFGPDGEWFVSGEKRDGSGAYTWWGGVDSSLSDTIKEWSGALGTSMQVSFGEYNGYAFTNGRKHGFCVSSNAGENLVSRAQRIRKRGKRIHKICLFPAGEYFISDDEGTEWSTFNTHLSKELKNGGNDPVLDVIKAVDGSWIVIRPNRYVSSTGVSSELTTMLSGFYSRHQQRQQSRARQISVYDAQVRERERREREAAELRAKEEREAEEATRLEQQAAEQRAKDAREEAERRAEAARVKEERIQNRREEQERIEQIHNKRLKTGEQVTVLGFSEEPGDAIITSVAETGEIKVAHSPDSESLVIRDPRVLSAYEQGDEDVEAISLLCLAVDKYEAAVSLFHCKCHSGMCQCKRVFSAQMNLRSTTRKSYGMTCLDVNSAPFEPGNCERVATRHVKPLLEHRGEVPRFDEYKCAEKIDFQALTRLHTYLEKDSTCRHNEMERLRKKTCRTQTDEEALKKLQRCRVLELIVQDLHNFLKDLPPDSEGFVAYEVDYEHRDASCRGRLFAKGRRIDVEGERYPRTSTLQGMHKDLRPRLVGKIAHDVDCENSEIRLVCSLASQLGIESLIPTVLDYRDNRQKWLERIAMLHDVSESDAKRLPNIILSGGRYETWLRAMKTTPSSGSSGANLMKEVKSFVFKLYAETHAIRDQLLGHGRFQWTNIERERLKKDGKSDRAIDSMLMPRIVQCCENEVLGIIHRCFEGKGWRVRAKVFDGLIAEDVSGTTNLADVMRTAEAACLSLGWDVRLVEKPLHGLQDQPVKTIQEARAVISSVHQSTRQTGVVRTVRYR